MDFYQSDNKKISQVVQDLLNEQGKTKKWLSEQLGLSYSTLHQKLDNNTFTAEEFLLLLKIFQVPLERFYQTSYHLKDLPPEMRPNVLLNDIDKYKNGGIFADSFHANGSRIYVPYGLSDALIEILSAFEETLEDDWSSKNNSIKLLQCFKNALEEET